MFVSGLCDEVKIERPSESNTTLGGRLVRTPTSSVLSAGYSVRLAPEARYEPGAFGPVGIVGSNRYVATGEITSTAIRDGDLMTVTGPPDSGYLGDVFVIRSATKIRDEAGREHHMYFELEKEV